MTITETTSTSTVPTVTIDLYRDIHKGIRAELFGVTVEAGRVDPSDRAVRTAVAGRVARLTTLLRGHAEHEDAHIQPALEVHLPELAATVAADHAVLEGRMDVLDELGARAVAAARGQEGTAMHTLYLELASFTGAYLAHQDVEERQIMAPLEAAIGVPAVGALHGAIIASIPPDEMAAALPLMLVAMNIDNRVEALSGMRATAPAPVFEGVYGLAASVLEPADFAALSARLGITPAG